MGTAPAVEYSGVVSNEIFSPKSNKVLSFGSRLNIIYIHTPSSSKSNKLHKTHSFYPQCMVYSIVSLSYCVYLYNILGIGTS